MHRTSISAIADTRERRGPGAFARAAAWAAAAALLVDLVFATSAARAACTWVDSIPGWTGSLSWSYSHRATWSDAPTTYDGNTRDEMSATFELDALAPGYAQGPMDGTMHFYDRMDTRGVGAPSFNEEQGDGPIDAFAPPPPQVTLMLDSTGCTYTFLYGPQLGTNGTSRVGIGSNVNSTPEIVSPGTLAIPGAIPLPSQPSALTFSGQVQAYADLLPLPPIVDPYFEPKGAATASAAALGDLQLGKASAQWAFQPTGFSTPRNDACAGAAALSGTTEDTTFATTSASDPTPSCGAGDRSVWFLVQAGEGGAASVLTTGSDYGTIVSVWPMAQPCGAITSQVACGAGSASWTADPGETYRVQVTRSSVGGGSLVAVAAVPEPDGSAGTFTAGAALALCFARRRRIRPEDGVRDGLTEQAEISPNVRGADCA